MNIEQLFAILEKELEDDKPRVPKVTWRKEGYNANKQHQEQNEIK